MLQLNKDVRDVFVLGIKNLNDFPAPYAERMKVYYRFSATRYTEDTPVIAKRIRDTLDLV